MGLLSSINKESVGKAMDAANSLFLKSAPLYKELYSIPYLANKMIGKDKIPMAAAPLAYGAGLAATAYLGHLSGKMFAANPRTTSTGEGLLAGAGIGYKYGGKRGALLGGAIGSISGYGAGVGYQRLGREEKGMWCIQL